MRKLKVPFAVLLLVFLFLISLPGHATNNSSSFITRPFSIKNKARFSAEKLYDSIGLANYGLSKKAWQYALKGYQKLVEKGRIEKSDVITICDFSLSSRQKRLFIIDLKNFGVVLSTYVAHGRKSGR